MKRPWLVCNHMLAAISGGDVEKAARVIDRGFDVDSILMEGKSAICISIERGKAELVELFLKKGCSLSLKTPTGDYPLHLAVKHRYNSLVEMLLNNRVDLTALDFSGKTALHIACEENLEDIARKLIQRSTVANLNIADSKGRTPLMYACEFARKDLVEYLISKGSKFNITDSSGESPLLLSVFNSSIEIMEYLLNIGVNVNTLPSLLRHFPRILCAVQGRQASKWPTGGNGFILEKHTVAASRVFSMGLNNQKVSAERKDSQRRNKSTMSGYALINNPKQFKGLGHPESERGSLEIRGLLPAAVRPVSLQVQSVLDNLNRYGDDLSRYLFLRELQDTNERLFYRVLCEHTEDLMPFVYTPVVGQACQEYSRIFRRPRGLFITINDLGQVYDILGNWPEENVKAIVVTDGERILGLGDLGANGMGIPVGKLSLYTALAGIPPAALLPVTLDVGTNNEELLADPFYIGLKQKRTNGEKYDQLIDEFMKAAVKRYGRSCLIQFEDFGNQNAFRLLEKYNDDYCTFNDDIQGTASVAVAGILASVKITGTKVSEHTFLFYGAGEAALGIADLLVMEMEEEGLNKEEAAKKIWMFDSRGLVVKSRSPEQLNGHKVLYAKEHAETKDLEEMVEHIKPSVLIGASAQPAVFTEKVLKMMLSNCERPIVFALSNPTDKAECTAEQAYTYTNGKCVFASGSPFPAVTVNGQTFHPGQGNNAYIFPGVSLALIACGAKSVGDKVFLVAAKALAEQVTKENMAEGRVYPPLDTIRKVSLTIAAKVARFLFQEGLATYKPEPPDLETFLATKQYSYDYDA